MQFKNTLNNMDLNNKVIKCLSKHLNYFYNNKIVNQNLILFYLKLNNTVTQPLIVSRTN